MSDWAQLIEDCENRESRMSDWERAFVDSVKARAESGKPLSDKRRDTLSTIWEKVTEKG